MVAAFCRHFPFQRKFVLNGADKSALARACHTARRPLFSCGLGVADYSAVDKVGAIDLNRLVTRLSKVPESPAGKQGVQVI